jgi:hypothetical protein
MQLISHIKRLLTFISPTNFNLKRQLQTNPTRTVYYLMLNFIQRAGKTTINFGGLLRNCKNQGWYTNINFDHLNLHQSPTSSGERYLLLTKEPPELICKRIWNLGYPDIAVQLRKDLEELNLWTCIS